MKHVLSQLPTYSLGCPNDVVVVFILLSILMSKNHLFIWKFILVNNIVLENVCGSRDFTCPLGMPKGLKGLFHTLNAIVSPTTADLCFLLSFCFSFCFAKGLAKCKFGGI
jgi:hypothetical protein